MQDIRVFENSEFGKVRVSVVDGEPMFCLSDVAKALGYSIPADAVSQHCKGGLYFTDPHRKPIRGNCNAVLIYNVL